MKQAFLIFFSVLLFGTASAAKNNRAKTPTASRKNITDTVPENLAQEDALIEEVLKTSTRPKKEKVQYFNQSTKYGFKNLFVQYSYNTTLPYTAQINPNAQSYVQDYMKTHGSYLRKMKDWGQPYFNLIDNVLQQYGLPKELKYIAVIESNLSTDVTSNAGAGGPWQLMPGTATDFGLVVNGAIDERRDYYKSTDAAARILLSLYKQYHDWLLVMAAYNGGPGRVNSAMKKSGSADFWTLQDFLPEESRTYVKRFIATHYIMEGGDNTNSFSTDIAETSSAPERTSYGLLKKANNPYESKPSLSATELAEVEVLSISGKYNSLIIAKNILMDIVHFNHFNPAFDATMSSLGNFDLRLPPDKMRLFETSRYLILNESVQALLGGAVVPNFKTNYPTHRKRLR